MTIRIEAENITNLTGGYKPQNNSVASGGGVLSLTGAPTNDVGTATFSFSGVSGFYGITLGFFDENDGEATIEVLQTRNGVSSGLGFLDETITLNKNLGSIRAIAKTQDSANLGNFLVLPGDVFTITGNENLQEPARFDYIEFVPIIVPEISITATVDLAGEPEPDGVFTVSLNQALPTDIVIGYSVSGTATEGADYTALTRTITIPQGSTEATITVDVIDDQIDEENETVTVMLTGVLDGNGDIVIPSSDAVFATTEATINISDDPIISINPTVQAGEPDTNGIFTVSLNRALSVDVFVEYSVSGTATEGEDYTALTKSVTIPQGSTEATINVDVIDDQISEGDETVIVTLTSSSNGATFDTSEATIQIADNDSKNIVEGTEGDDVLRGVHDNDCILGLGGNDFITGRNGDDEIRGGAGEDFIRGRVGDDEISGGDDNDILIGHRGNDTINGDSGDDFIKGGKGEDTINGGIGNDRLLGGLHDDTIDGGEGDDTLVGGLGRDILFGGSGADIFLYRNLRDGKDVIEDFEVGKDVIRLRRLINEFKINKSEAFGVNVLVVNKENSTLVKFDQDGSGQQSAVTLLELATPVELSVSSFVL